MRHTVLMALVVTAARVVAVAQFVPDTAFRPPIEKPAFFPQKGPVVLVDEAHFNVSGGGALLLIADHRPFAGAAETLGRAFGIRFLDGAVTRRGGDGDIVFRKSEGTLIDDPITKGIDDVATFKGSSIRTGHHRPPIVGVRAGDVLVTAAGWPQCGTG